MLLMNSYMSVWLSCKYLIQRLQNAKFNLGATYLNTKPVYIYITNCQSRDLGTWIRNLVNKISQIVCRFLIMAIISKFYPHPKQIIKQLSLERKSCISCISCSIMHIEFLTNIIFAFFKFYKMETTYLSWTVHHLHLQR